MKYETIKIESVCIKVISGGTPLTSQSSFYYPQEIPWLKTAEVNYCRIYDTENYISKEGLERSSAKLIPENSIIVAMYGQGDTAGRVAINKIPLSTNQACCNLIVNPEIANYEYVYYALSNIYDKLVSLKNGGAQPNLNVAIVKSIEIPFPKLEIQNKIAAILSAYDNLIENNQKQIKLLEEAVQRLYKEWFVDLRFPNYEECKIIDGVPEGWKRLLISDVCETIGGGTPATRVNEYYQDGEIRWVTPTDITKNKSIILLDSEKKITKLGLERSAARMVPPYTILMTSRASVGYFGICEHEVCTNQGFISCVPFEENVRYFLLYNLMNRVEEIRQKASGSTFLEISKKSFRELEIVLPDSHVLEMFNKVIIPYIKQIEVSVKKMSQLLQARERILPKLMSREIEI